MRYLIIAALLLQSAGCGTIMHPERKGQKDGRIDAGIAVLDGIGLLFFILPGVVAFAVDFSNGTIYLPGGSSRGEIRFDPRGDEKAAVERIIRERTGRPIDLDRLEVRELKSVDELPARFAEVAGRTS
jgi:hypothetical protein